MKINILVKMKLKKKKNCMSFYNIPKIKLYSKYKDFKEKNESSNKFLK